MSVDSQPALTAAQALFANDFFVFFLEKVGDVKIASAKINFNYSVLCYPLALLGKRFRRRNWRFLALSQDIGRDVFNSLIQMMGIGKGIRLFINLNSVQRILYVFYTPVYTKTNHPAWVLYGERYFSAKFVTSYFSSDELRDLLAAGQWRSQNYFWMVVQSLIQFENQVVEWHYYSTHRVYEK